MILQREQINRYLRHIIIPEISGQGQKKIIESRAFVLADSAKDAASILFYLAASGVGNISCCFIKYDGYEKLFDNIMDLNSECKIELIDIEVLNEEGTWYRQRSFTLSIILLQKYSFIDTLLKYPNAGMICESTPTVLAVYDGWKGFIQLIGNKDSLTETCSNLIDRNNKEISEKSFHELGSVFATSILGSIAVIEYVKLILNIGSKLEGPLFINLLSMDFKKSNSVNINEFFSSVNSEMNKLCDTTKSLSECKVLIVGAGGLGSPAALALANAGVGTIGFVDYDKVEISNLNRQIMHSTSRIGSAKVESAEIFIKSFSSDINVITNNVGLNKSNVMKIISEYDVVIDGVDNFPTRYLLNDACYFAGKPMIEAGAVRFIGLNMTIIPRKGTCYRCVFPFRPEISRAQTCAEVGVLGPVPGLMGFIQAAETAKLLLGKGELLVNKIMYFDALDLDFDVINVEKASKCILCGNSPSINELEEYNFSCKV
jgi:molybdopterin/thiamine biosynthesis adenylyltransferase